MLKINAAIAERGDFMNYKRKRECIAMLLAGGVGSRLYKLTDRIAKPAVAFGGKYKIIDFTLSNCANSGIDVVGVLTQYRPLALNEYIGNGDAWKLDTSDGGIVLLPPYQAKRGADWYAGTANAIYQNLEFIDAYSPDHVLILSGDHIYRMDYEKMLEQHRATGADCTVATVKVPFEDASRFGILSSDESGRITDFAEKPSNPKSNNASMGVYVFKADVLRRHLIKDAENRESSHDFGKDIIPDMLSCGEAMYSYEFDGYWRDVGTLGSYLEAHTDMLGETPAFEIFDENMPVYTKDRALPPHYVGEGAEIENALIGAGSIIEGSVKDSVIFENAEIKKGASVMGSAVLEGAKIEDNVSGSIVEASPADKRIKRAAVRPRRDVCGIIFSNLHDKNVVELTRCRTTAAIPFAGRYRLIDFPLSSMIGSGIRNIKIIAHHNYNSLMEHIGSGGDFGLSVDRGGIKILPPYIKAFLNGESGLYGSRLEAMMGIKDVIERTGEKYTVLSDCDLVGRIDLNDMIDHHVKTKADITMATRKRREGFARDTVIIKSDAKGRITDVRREEDCSAYGEDENLNIWVANTEYLKRILRDAQSHGYRSFTRDVLGRNLGTDRYYVFRYEEPMLKIGSLKEYFDANMSLISDSGLRASLFGERDILSKTSSITPTRYLRGASVKSSLIAEGCVIEGTVENSVISEGVYIARGASVRNSILLPNASVGENSRINCAVIEKNTKIEKGSELFGCFELPFYVQGELIYR